MSDMNIEYTGRLYDTAKVRRFAGKVYDRVARSSRIMLSVFIVVGLAAEVMAYLRGGHLDLYLLFLLALIVFTLKFNRGRFQKSMDLVIRRFLGDSDEGTVAMTDTCYEIRSGDNVMRVVWRNLGSYYVFLDGGLAVLERNLPTLLLPSLVSLGASEEEVKSALEKAGLKDYRHCRSYWWVFVLLAALMGGVVAQFDLMQYRANRSAPTCVECDDEEEEVDEDLFSETGRFQEAIAEADRVVIRDGGFGCCTKPERDPVLLELKDPKEIAELRGIFKFEDRGSNAECMCCGHPGIDWWKGDELLARTAVQHLKALRWKRFHGDAELTPEAAEALSAWFSARGIKPAN